MERVCDNCMKLVPSDAENCPNCGISFENNNPGGALPNGWVLAERYTVGRYLDIDGEGVMYSAIDAQTMQRVNLKEFMPVTLCAKRDDDGSLVSKPGCEVLFKTTRVDFAELYQSLLGLGEQEGLVRVLDVFEENNTAYAVTEKLEGQTLTEYLKRMELPLSHTRVLSLLGPVFRGLEAMHAAGIIHRGVCPDNIVLQSGGIAKLGGYATLALRQQGSELKAKLYEGYSAPEQYSASEFEGQYTDIYALSAVIFRMVTGTDPKAADQRKIQDTIRGVRSYSKEIPAYFSLGILQAMRIAPAERFQSVEEFLSALQGETKVAAAGLFGLTQKQLIIVASALGVILVALLIILFVSLFSGRGADPSSSETSISATPTPTPSPSPSPSASTKEVVMPSFVNKRLSDIRDASEYADFIFAEPVEVYHDTLEAGVIIEQKPAAGQVWDGETPIQLTVSKGKAVATLPDLVGGNGYSEAAAKKALEELGFTNVKTSVVDNNGQYTEGMVVKQSPSAGQSISLETEITLYVAGNFVPVKMPNLLTLTEAEAKRQLDEAKIKYGDVQKRANDGSSKPGTVIETSIAAGNDVNIGRDTITLTIADDVSLPNLAGMTIAQVDAEFARLKTTTSGISLSYYLINEESATVTAGTVIRTEKDGQTVKDGEQVILYIAMAPAATTPPPTETPASTG